MDGIDSVRLESRLAMLCTVDWTAGNDLGMLAGSLAYEYACTAKPGPGLLSSALQSWILEWIS
jgi:hypothetical protein